MAQLKNSTLTETSTALHAGPTNHSELDQHLLTEAQATLATGTPLQLTLPINRTDCAVGAPLAAAIADRFGEQGLPDGTVSITFHGCAGQKFGAHSTGGLELTLIGKAGDYVGQAMAGGQIVVRPSLKSQLEINNGKIAGNSVIEGASGGSLFVAGQAGKFFARHNRGATAVVEGVGDYACTEMVDGVVVVLGQTGQQFGLGMYGGMGFVLHTAGNSAIPPPDETTPLPAQFIPEAEQELLKYLVMRHVRVTGSVRGQEILADWSTQVERFRKFAPPAPREKEGSALDPGFLF